MKKIIISILLILFVSNTPYPTFANNDGSKEMKERQKCSKYEHNGFSEGYDIGLMSGEMIERNETIRRLLDAGFKDEEVMKFADVTAKYLENIKGVLKETGGKLPEDPDYARWMKKKWYKDQYGIDVEVKWALTAREDKLEKVLLYSLHPTIQRVLKGKKINSKPYTCPQLIELEPLPEYGTENGTSKYKLKLRVYVGREEIMMWLNNVDTDGWKLLKIKRRTLKENEPVICN